jgi:hypothetical protein
VSAAELLEQLRAELGADVLGLLGYGLGLADEPLSFLGQAFRYEADSDGDSADRLAELAMRLALRRIQMTGDEALLARLEDASGPPWSWVFEAVMAVDVEIPA